MDRVFYCFALAVLVVAVDVFAVAEDVCWEDGGTAICSAPQVGEYTYKVLPPGGTLLACLGSIYLGPFPIENQARQAGLQLLQCTARSVCSFAYACETDWVLKAYHFPAYPETHDKDICSGWLTRGWGWKPLYTPGPEAARNLSLPPWSPGTGVRPANPPWWQPVRGSRLVGPAFGQPGGGAEYYRG